jgi:hypothetical protein
MPTGRLAEPIQTRQMKEARDGQPGDSERAELENF